MSPTVSFISDQPNIGDPSLHWADFETPKLRRFPHSNNPCLELPNNYLGGGVDGFVFKAEIDGHPVAVKIFLHNRQPEPVDGIGFYWAFERECINCALLQMIDASLQRAATTKRPIYVLSRPTTKAEALRNLWAFSDEGNVQCDPPPQYSQFNPPDVQINKCLGWTKLTGRSILQALNRARILTDIKSDETYFPIVYDFVPKGKLEADTILSQLDFFHVAGFYNVPFNPTNWLGRGVLVDFSDIVSPLAHELDWDKQSYAMNQEMYHAGVRSFERKGLL
ncbi:hypothetical protein GE09DRAFT_619468 [Coniochaeta sp. 2T2.1]|nr:hypothetical protein GE09DRAFT_619468 [Coniochaeta sp. 2T2.1]